MALETGDFIGELDPANPPGADPKSQGDDHIRLIKHTLQGTFGDMLGLWELPTNNVPIKQSNFAASGFIDMIRVNPQDQVEIGEVLGTVLLNGALVMSTNNTFISQGNFAADGVIDMIKVNASDQVELGAPVRVGGSLEATALKQDTTSSNSRIIVNSSDTGGVSVVGIRWESQDVFKGQIVFNEASDLMEIYGANGSFAGITMNASPKVFIPNGDLQVSLGVLTVGDALLTAAHANYDDVLIGSLTGNHGLTVVANTAGFGGLAFSDGPGGTIEGLVSYQFTARQLVFYAGGVEQMQLQSDGDLILHQGDMDISLGNLFFAAATGFPGSLTADGQGIIFTKGAEGLTLVGRGTSFSFQMTNGSGATICRSPNGTLDFECVGDITAFA